MECNKKGASAGTPTPSRITTKHHNNSNRLKRICPLILFLAAFGFLAAYHFKSVNAMYTLLGVIITTSFFEVLINPIPDEEDE